MPTSSDRRPISRRSLLQGIGLAGATILAACTGKSSTGTSKSSKSAGQPKIIHVRDFGAVGDGKTDDTAALMRAFAALHSGQTLQFAADSVFCHTGVLVVDTPDVTLQGPGVLKATNEAASALQIAADRVTVSGMTLSMGATTQRWSTPDQHKLYIGSTTGVVVADVVIDGSAAAGVFCSGASNFSLRAISVIGTRADGIHMTNGTHDGTVDSPMITMSGDDGVAVVSYLNDKSRCRNISVTSPTVKGTTGGRGISVVGGENVRYSEITIFDSFAASVYIACEGGDFVTQSTQDVQVTGGRITGANTATAIDHGAVLIYSGRPGGIVEQVTISGLTITDTRTTASRQIGVVSDDAKDLVSDISFVDLHLAAAPQPYQGDAPIADVVLTNVTAASRPVVASQAK